MTEEGGALHALSHSPLELAGKGCWFILGGLMGAVFFLGLGCVGHGGHAVLLCLWEGECWVGWRHGLGPAEPGWPTGAGPSSMC